MTLVWFGLVGLAALATFALLVTAARRQPVIGDLFVALSVLTEWESPNPPPLVVVSGTSIYWTDIFCAVFLAIGVSRFSQLKRNIGFAVWPWLGLGALLLISLIRGLGENAFGTTFNEFRSYVYPFVAMTWAMSLRWTADLQASLIKKFSVVLGWGLVVIAIYHMALYGLGSTSTFVDVSTGLAQTTRPLVSGQALMLLLCAIVSLWFWRKEHRRPLLVSSVAFLCVVIISEQRTVWAVAVAVLIAVFIVGRAKARGAIFGLVLMGALLGAIVVAGNLAPALVTKLSAAASDVGTYDARLRSWSNLTDKSVSEGPLTVIFGQPMGAGFGRFEGPGRWVVFAPHNWYVTIFLRAGSLGLGLLLLFMVFLMLRVVRRRADVGAFAVLIAVAVYGWSYSWPWYIAAFYGWASAAGSPDGVSELESPRQAPLGAPMRTAHTRVGESP